MLFSHQQWLAGCGAALVAFSLTAHANAALIVDLRATSATGSLSLNDSKTLTYNPLQGTGSATMQIWAVATGASGNSALEGFQFAYGSFLSSNLPSPITGGTVRGTLTATVHPSFLEGSGPNAGGNVDLDGDSDFDVGGAAQNNSANWFYGRSNEIINTANAAAQGVTFNPLADGGIEILLGTLAFDNLSAVSGALTTDLTQINWAGRIDGTTFASFLYQQDGATVTAATNQFLAAGLPVNVNVNAIPEPGTYALGTMLLAGLAGWKLRRKKLQG